MPNADVSSKIKPDLSLAEPPLYRVIYLNDDTTTMEYVISSLMQFFNYNIDTAIAITEEVHNSGSAVAAILPYEIAEQKAVDVVLDSRAKGFKLQIEVKPETLS